MASAICGTSICCIVSISAMVLASLIVLWTTLADKANDWLACLRKSSASFVNVIYVSISLDVICALVLSFVHSNLFCCCSRDCTTFSLSSSEEMLAFFSKIVSIFSLGISIIISNLSNSGPEILF